MISFSISVSSWEGSLFYFLSGLAFSSSPGGDSWGIARVWHFLY
jgi:hypothetical protein